MPWRKKRGRPIEPGKLATCEAFRITRFWAAYDALPLQIQELADANFTLLKRNPRHPSLQFKKVGQFWSARVGLRYRALAVGTHSGYLWFWIGSHAEYDRLVN